MALLYRVTMFGEPKGPWRGRERLAKIDAVSLGLGVYDHDDGEFYLDAPCRIEWVRQEDLRKSA